jgi:hypothetical protein
MLNQPRSQLNPTQNHLPQTLSILDIEVGDTCKFKGTRDKGYRRIMEMNQTTYFCRVVEFKKGVVHFTNFTSTNGREKLDSVFRKGIWMKVIH